MTPETEWNLNAASAAGILILSVPAFSLNSRKKSLFRIKNILKRRKPGAETSALNEIAEELEDKATERANNWQLADQICLFVGYFLLLGSSIIRVWLTW